MMSYVNKGNLKYVKPSFRYNIAVNRFFHYCDLDFHMMTSIFIYDLDTEIIST